MKSKTLCRLLSGAAFAALSAPAHGQDTTPDSWTVETVTVIGEADQISAPEAATATRTPTPIEEIPQSIQVLTRTLLEEQDLQTISDALVNVSGVTPSSTMQTVLAAPNVRGFGASYFYDGMPAYQLPAGISDPSTLINAQRIEVAKGPSSTLYGGGTGAPLAGLINIVSRDPDPIFSGEAIFRGGSFETFGGQGRLSIPLADQAGLSLAAMYESTGSFLDTVESERYALFPTLSWSPAASTTLTLRGQINHLEQLEYSGLPVELIGIVDRNTFAGAEDAPRTEVDNSMLTASLTHRFSDMLQADFNIRRYDGDFREYSTYPLGAALGTTYFFGSGQVPSNVEQTFLTFSLLSRFETGGLRHQLLAGADYDATDYYGAMGLDFAWGLIDYADSTTNAPFGVLPAITEEQNDELRTIAVFVQDQVSIGEHLDLTASVRWSSLDVKSNYTSFGIPFVDTDDRYSKFSPRVGLTYELTEGVSAFAGYAEGFRGVVAAFGVTDPEPETSQSYEAGFKFAEPVPGLSGTIALFNVTRQNVITSDPMNPFQSIQTGEQRARGFETDLIYEPDPAFSFLLSYAYTDAEVTEDNTIPVGNTLRAVPQHRARLAARYRFQEGFFDPLEIGGGMTVTSERELTLPNTTNVEGNVLFDLQAAWDFGPASLGVSIVNLTDDGSFEPYQYFGGQYVIPVQPRSAFVSLRGAF